MALIKSLYREVDGLSLLFEAMNFDFKTKGMDEAFRTEELAGMSGMQAMRDRVMRVIGHNPTVRDFLEVTRRGRPRESVVGSGKDIADYLEQVVHRTRLRRVRHRRHPHARHIRGFCSVRCAGTAAAWPVSQGVYRRDAAGEPGAASAEAGGVASAGSGRLARFSLPGVVARCDSTSVEDAAPSTH